jgi:hypothetical protein
VNVYPFIEAEKAQQRTVKRACQLLEVSRAAYYTHRAGTLSARQRTDDELTGHIRAAHQASQGRYGAHASTRSCGEAATGTGASASPGCCAPPGCAGAPRAGSRARPSRTRRRPPGQT